MGGGIIGVGEKEMNLIHMYAQFWWTMSQYWYEIGAAWQKFLNEEMKDEA